MPLSAQDLGRGQRRSQLGGTMDIDPASGPIRRYQVWDRTTRAFHWVNVLCILVLAAIGTILLNGKRLGIPLDGTILLKAVHAYVGYVFALNLGWRLVWTFAGNRYARWHAILPMGSGFAIAVRDQVRALLAGRAAVYVGHTPLGRVMITMLILLLAAQAMTGLLLAGTDLYLPPFGAYFADWVTGGDAQRLALLRPGSREYVLIEAYDAMRTFRQPVLKVHEFGFYALLVAVFVHVAANVLDEVRHATGQISAMFSGVKSVAEKPMDEPDT